MTIFKPGFIAAFAFVAGSGFAAIISTPTCVTNISASGWSETGTDGGACAFAAAADPLLPATFVVAEGSETALDPVGDFTFNKVFTSPNTYFTIMEPTGAVSDYILAGNTAPGGFGEILFYSDQVPPGVAIFNFAGVVCTESASGCVGSTTMTFTDGSGLTITAASDGDTGTFDPFQSGTNTSDGIRFSSVPEPSTLLLIPGLLFVFARVSRRRA